MTKKPSYRFAGYTEPWERRKLGEISSRVKGNDGRMDLPTLTISAGQGWLDQRERFSGNIAGKEQKNYTLLRIGELSYNHGNSKLAKYGVVFQLNNYTEALVPKVYHSFKMIDGRSGTFFEYLFATKIPDRELGKLVSSGARMDGLLNITYDDFMSIKLTFPKNNEEQTAIGSFFQDIDQLISLQQRKLEVLKEQKKTYLKLLFPTKGQTKPALRFAGFEDDWKEVKLGEILVERNEQISESEEYQLMSFVQGKGVVPKSDRYDRSFLVKDDKKNYKKTEYGDFIYSSNNLDTGSIGFNKTGKALISPVYSIFYSKTKKESQFIAILSQRKEFINEMIKYRQGVVYGQFRIHESDFLNIKILAPESNEQEFLITFFQDLDKAIAKQEEKVNQLKESKQTLLRKMFI
ncbi:restriction endonuclease subunit S [Streptococcus hohhotensis]|jgi:type IC hsdS subunit|uniref:Restriction endonuclease subunit S n=1 Tax=Streptococcus hohhotensis TaxID=2866998 RepID=A0ABT6QEF2_9STRE|nr:restriction endonuclease subunit S [Streptococcus sp. IMAU 99199]MDI2139272.1 restriction endonuclease subunit S [Streptococcus sp. IMAU 99199]